MGFQCGIVGLPNVGKSTLFNALVAGASAAAANYPFCTIEPNAGRVPVPDPRLAVLARICASARIVPTVVDIVDIAGLVAGASRGEGLGNRFLGHIREVDALIHVLRCFADEEVSHVSGNVDPLRDAAIVETELMLADLETLERRDETLTKRARGGDRGARTEQDHIAPALAALSEGRAVRTLAREARAALAPLHLLTAKPVLYVCNVAEAALGGDAIPAAVAAHATAEGARCIAVSAAVEAELARIEDAPTRAAFLAELGLAQSGLDQLVRAGHELLDLITFFTAGPKEAHAWTLRRGADALAAAGAIHTDFARGFIRVEVIGHDDFVALGGEQAAKDAGRMRIEGRDYVVRDGDVLHFRFNV